VFHGEPTAEVMKQMGYAASAFGNHEVDFGRPQFARNREGGGFPYLAANLPAAADSDSAAPLGLQASLLVKRKGVEIAVVGLTTQKTLTTTVPGRLDDVTLVDDAQAMAALPTIAKADAVVVLTDGCLADFAPVLEAHPEWKVTVAAGQQCKEAFPPNAGGAHLVYVGRRFQSYARAKLTFRGDKLTGVVAETVDVGSGEPAEPKAKELVDGWKKKLDDMLGEQIGFSAKGIEQDSPQMGTWLATALKEKYQADVGLTNAKGARAALPKGPVTRASVFDLIPFENTVVVLKVPGEQLKAQLKNSEARVAGLKGGKVDPKKTYTVATHSFVFFGGDGFALQGLDPKPNFTGEPWQDAVIEWTKKQASDEKKPLEGFIK
jgi:2',3'-cyclic-nucleotide 2'-phosphodiesterase (5'-nucleotidase family)